VFVRVAWIVVFAAACLRLIVAARLPLSGDEAYYWEWSRRLAFGYVDHPPMVAWLIALFSFGVKSVALVRLPFVLCGLGAAGALGAFAARATNDARAGTAAALLLSLAPFATIAFTMASPDGPQLLFWSVSLYAALRVIDGSHPAWLFALAAALAATFLSSVLGGFLITGVVTALMATHPRFQGASPSRIATPYVAGALLLFALLVAGYIRWDATHGWHALRFAVFGRHPFVPGGNFLALIGVYAAVLTPGLFIVLFAIAARLAHPRTGAEKILALTAFPLVILCLALSLRERVEFNWADGAFCSLLAATGLYAPAFLRRAAFVAVTAQAAAIAALLFVIAALPMQSLRFAERSLGIHLRNQGAFEIWAFQPAARDVAREARAGDAMVMTDGYGLSSVLDFYADIPPVVIGYDAQGREARRWLGRIRRNAIFFDKEPLATRPDFARQLRRACTAVRDDGSRTYMLQGQVTRTFYLTRCDGLTPQRFALLLFPNKTGPKAGPSAERAQTLR
jgi:4-amino-4-deoxy-L-arabinose transferase-like glycosyltransferase